MKHANYPIGGRTGATGPVGPAEHAGAIGPTGTVGQGKLSGYQSASNEDDYDAARDFEERLWEPIKSPDNGSHAWLPSQVVEGAFVCVSCDERFRVFRQNRVSVSSW